MLICWRVILVALTCLVALAGCAGGGANIATPVGAAKAGLSLGEIDAVTVAARRMVGDEQAQVHGLKSRNETGVGTHVCGYVRSGSRGSTPIYVELRAKDAVVTAERGQVGATPENLAKVKFMCRNHGDW